MEENKIKGFWQRKEGVTGGVVLALGVCAVVYGLFLLAPLLESALVGGLALIAFIVLAYIALDPRTHLLFKTAMRWLTGCFVEIDPIAVMKTCIQAMKKNQANMENQIKNLDVQIVSLDRVVAQNQREANESLGMANKAKQTGKDRLVALKARKAGKLEKSNMTLQDLSRKLNLLKQVLLKMDENVGIAIEDAASDVDIKERERKSLAAGSSAFRSAMKVIKGGSEKDMYDFAMEKTVEDINEKLGEMQHFMEMSADFMENLDLQNGVYEEEGLRKLEEWSQRTDSKLLGNDKTLLIDRANKGETLTLPDASNKYANLWKE